MRMGWCPEQTYFVGAEALGNNLHVVLFGGLMPLGLMPVANALGAGARF